jgi:hypothetical protein
MKEEKDGEEPGCSGESSGNEMEDFKTSASFEIRDVAMIFSFYIDGFLPTRRRQA